MAQDSKIEWTHHTGNSWHGCFKVHVGCDNCYAETMAIKSISALRLWQCHNADYCNK